MTVISVPRPSNSHLGAAIREFAIPLIVVALFAIGGFGVAWSQDISLPGVSYLGRLTAYELCLAAGFAIVTLYVRRWFWRENGAWVPGWDGWRRATGPEWRSGVLQDRLARVAVAAVLFSVSAAVFLTLKSAIPEIHPFAWDARLSRWSIAFHGRPDWLWIPRWTQSAFGLITLEHVYSTMIPGMTAVVFWWAWSRDEERRRRFFASFALAWFVIGIVAATWLSSAGPAFYGRLVGQPDPYAPLLANLRHAAVLVNLRSPIDQDQFWQAYISGGSSASNAISAMPSMHVAMPVLYAFAARRWWSKLAFVGYGIAIWLATVALGWHYAFDGYVSAVMIAVIWFATGWATSRKLHQR